MPEYLSPGVYVEEISTGPKPIEGVSTSVAGFVGPTERGPQDIRYINSWLTYQRWYGSHLGADKSYMSYAVQGFFDNGGQRCFIGRIVRENALHANLTVDNLTLTAIGAGNWGNGVFIRILQASKVVNGVDRAVNDPAGAWVRVQAVWFQNPPQGTPVDFTLPSTLGDPNRREPDVFEDFDDLSLDSRAPNFLASIVNLESKLVRAQFAGVPASPTIGPDFRPLENGTDTPDGSSISLTDYQGDLDPINGNEDLFGRGKGLLAMETVDEISLLMAPDHVLGANAGFRGPLEDALDIQCRKLQDRFAVLALERGAKSDAKPTIDTSRAAQYYPWIRIYDTYTRDEIPVPPTGHVAGIIARTDIERGVHKPPANSVVIGARALDKPVPKSDQDLLNPVGINCIRDFRADGRGIRLWGARTMSSDPEWKYINVRRLFLFIEESINEGTQWVVFEPNSQPTWSSVILSVTGFLDTVWKSGALMGSNQDEAFFVKCGRETMSEDDINNGRLICYIGIAPVKPAEFVIFRIGQKTAEASA